MFGVALDIIKSQHFFGLEISRDRSLDREHFASCPVWFCVAACHRYQNSLYKSRVWIIPTEASTDLRLNLPSVAELNKVDENTEIHFC